MWADADHTEKKKLPVGIESFEKIRREGAPARDAYKEFLKTGSSGYPVELLKIAGVDMSSKEPVIMAMETFKKLVEEFENTI